jgi:hypothetical protein
MEAVGLDAEASFALEAVGLAVVGDRGLVSGEFGCWEVDAALAQIWR